MLDEVGHGVDAPDQEGLFTAYKAMNGDYVAAVGARQDVMAVATPGPRYDRCHVFERDRGGIPVIQLNDTVFTIPPDIICTLLSMCSSPPRTQNPQDNVNFITDHL